MQESAIVNFGIVGLGKMGANLARRLQRSGIVSVIFDANSATTTALANEGFIPTFSYRELAEKLPTPRTIWVMVPAAITEEVIVELSNFLIEGDTIIDGGNSHYQSDLINEEYLRGKGINFVDVGTSGGVYGLERGYSLMIGGDEKVVASLTPIFLALAPGVESAERTPGMAGVPTNSEEGFLHCGPVGSGHYVKMIHNGIEYAMMAAMSEGLAILEADPVFKLDIAAITQVWRRGSVISSWLLDLTSEALQESPHLDSYGTAVSDSGEGRWAVQVAVDLGVPVPVLSASLFSRFSSRGNADYSNKLLNAMRYKFGGHSEHVKRL